MRLIKCKMWKNNKMFGPVDFSNLGKIDIISDTIGSILLQYTGLKDCKGIEIYEGDIIKNSLNDILEVVWNEDRCCFEIRGRYENSYIQKQLDCDIIIDLNIKVIGNIYEIPELLIKDQK